MAVNHTFAGFSEEENQKITSYFNKLAPHINLDKVAIVGGLAVRYQLAKRGIEYSGQPFNDLDFVFQAEEDVKPSITVDFMVYHHHRKNGDEIPYFALVDDSIGIKGDFFGSRKVYDFETVKIGNNEWKIATLEDQLPVTVMDVLNASEKQKMDPKLVEELGLLADNADIEKAEKIFEGRGKSDLAKYIRDANNLYNNHPGFFAPHPFRKPGPYKCQLCVDDPNYPLTPMEGVYKVLGYVE